MSVPWYIRQGPRGSDYSKVLNCLERRWLAVAPAVPQAWQELTAAPAELTAPGATAVVLAAAVEDARSWPISLACTPCDDEPVCRQFEQDVSRERRQRDLLSY